MGPEFFDTLVRYISRVMTLAIAVLLWVFDRLTRLTSWRRMVPVAVLGLFGAVVCGINYDSNRIVVLKYNFAEHIHRSLIENAMRCGLMRSVPAGSYLLCDLPIRSWDSPAFFKMHSGLTLQVVRPKGFSPDEHLGISSIEEAFGNGKPWTSNPHSLKTNNHSRLPALSYRVIWNGSQGPVLKKVVDPGEPEQNRPAFLLRYEAQSKGVGFAVLARIVELQADNNHIFRVYSDKVRLYVGIPTGHPSREVRIGGTWLDKDTRKPSGAFLFQEQELGLLAKDRTGKVLEIPASRMKGLIDPESITVAFTAAGRGIVRSEEPQDKSDPRDVSYESVKKLRAH